MKDLKFEQKGSLSRTEAADLLSALAAALRHGDSAQLDFGPGTLSLRIPEKLRSEVEIEVDEGHVELEIELKWAIGQTDGSTAHPAPGAPDAPAPG